MFQDRLKASATEIGAHLDHTLSRLRNVPVVAAMRHATNGGKRLRGFLVLESSRLHGVDPARAIWPATAIECMHAYSLVHDDLPAMDDDDIRRGQPTVHRKWDEATAILAGDALQSLAFELCAQEAAGPGTVRAALCQSLAQAAGAEGMVLGQALDIAAESAAAPLSLEAITDLQKGKTGALIEWSAMTGARLAEADPSALAGYASALGLAFQIADDILDVEGDAEAVGKATGKDAAAGKATFVSLLGLSEAKRRASELVDIAQDCLSSYGSDAEILRETARFVIARKT